MYKVVELQRQLKEVVDSRAAVEQAVRSVMEDNERLSQELQALSTATLASPQQECHR